MKVTSRNARIDRAGKHNDRNYDVSTSKHIDTSRSADNKYYTYNGDYEQTFDRIERDFYERHFRDAVYAQNQRNIQGGHARRNKTMDDYVRGKFTRPEDKILQIGDIFEHVDGDTLWECALAYEKEFTRRFGEHCVILDMALHMDEATPHVHVRRVWVDTDDYGYTCVSQNRALASMGFERPDATKETGKYNNAKIPFSESDRNLFLSVCKEKGIEFENAEKTGKVHSEPIKAYKERHPVVERIRQMEGRLSELQSELEDKQTAADELNAELLKIDHTADEISQMLMNFLREDEEYRKRIEKAEKESRDTRLKELNAIYMETISAATEGHTVSIHTVRENMEKEIEIRKMKRFMERKGIYDEYENSRNEKKEKERDGQKRKQ